MHFDGFVKLGLGNLAGERQCLLAVVELVLVYLRGGLFVILSSFHDSAPSLLNNFNAHAAGGAGDHAHRGLD